MTPATGGGGGGGGGARLWGQKEPLLATVKRRKLARFGHVMRHESLSKIILQGTLECGRRRGRQRKCWTGNVSVHVSTRAETAHDGLPAEKTGKEILVNHLSCPPDDQGGHEVLTDLTKPQEGSEHILDSFWIFCVLFCNIHLFEDSLRCRYFLPYYLRT